MYLMQSISQNACAVQEVKDITMVTGIPSPMSTEVLPTVVCVGCAPDFVLQKLVNCSTKEYLNS